MAHWAEIDNNNKVIRVTVGDNNAPEGDKGYQWLVDNLGGTWIECDPHTYGGKNLAGVKQLRKNYPGPGYTYDATNDAFYGPQPFPSWILNQETFVWGAPTPKPTEEGTWVWDESQIKWIDLTK
jgi:hypothetical protein